MLFCNFCRRKGEKTLLLFLLEEMGSVHITGESGTAIFQHFAATDLYFFSVSYLQKFCCVQGFAHS